MKFFFLVTITQAFFAPRAAPRSSIYRASFSLHSNVPASPLQPDSPETRATTTPEKAKTRPANLPRTSFPTSATLIMNPASSSLPFTATHLSIPDLFTSFLFDIPQYNEEVTSLLSSDPPTTMIISSRDGIYDSAHDSFATTRVRQRPPPDLQLWRNKFRKMKVIAHRHAIPFRYQNKKLVDYVLEGYGPWSVSMSEGDVRDLSKEDDHDSDVNAVKIYYTPGFTPGTLTTIVPNVLASGGRQRSGLIFSGNIIPVEDEYGIENVSDAPKIEEQFRSIERMISEIATLGRGEGPGFMFSGRDGEGIVEGLEGYRNNFERWLEFLREAIKEQ